MLVLCEAMRGLDNRRIMCYSNFTMDNSGSHSETRGAHSIQSLARGLQILRCFSSDAPTLSLTDISQQVGLPKATAYRYVSTLKALGYLAQDGKRGTYKLSVKVLDLGFSALNSLSFLSVALPYLEKLAQKSQESASMAVLEESDVIYVARAATKRWMSTNLQIGSKLPAYCTSMGKALLAYRPFDEVSDLLKNKKLIAHTPYTITDLGRLKEILAKIRKDGYAINDQELEIGLCSAAAPVRGVDGEVIAAINISMAAARVPVEVLQEKFIPYLLSTAREISRALGYRSALEVQEKGSPTEKANNPSRSRRQKT